MRSDSHWPAMANGYGKPYDSDGAVGPRFWLLGRNRKITVGWASLFCILICWRRPSAKGLLRGFFFSLLSATGYISAPPTLFTLLPLLLDKQTDIPLAIDGTTTVFTTKLPFAPSPLVSTETILDNRTFVASLATRHSLLAQVLRRQAFHRNSNNSLAPTTPQPSQLFEQRKPINFC